MKALMIALALAGATTPAAKAPTPAPAPAGQADCAGFNRVIDEAMMDLSYSTAAMFLDDSAPRLTLRNEEVANAWRAIEVNLTLLAAGRCPMPKNPISATSYSPSADLCDLAKTAEDRKKACDRSNWIRGDGRPSLSPHENKLAN